MLQTQGGLDGIAIRHAQRQETYDLRGQIHAEEQQGHHDIHGHIQDGNYTSDEEHSVLEDDSDAEMDGVDYVDDDDASSSLSIPNESINFDLFYSLHSFAATVEGQANVVKGDSLVLMDDSNSYWWLVRVLKTQEIGYIPAENIETPFERLARLNKHRNVDLASATQEELFDDHEQERKLELQQIRSRSATSSRGPPSGNGSNRKSVVFNSDQSIFNYPPAVWDSGEEWEEDSEMGEHEHDGEHEDHEEDEGILNQSGGPFETDDDDMSWDDEAALHAQQSAARGPSGHGAQPDPGQSLKAVDVQGPARQVQVRIQEPSQQGQNQAQSGVVGKGAAQQAQQAGLGLGQAPSIRTQTSRERLFAASQQMAQQQSQQSSSSSGSSPTGPTLLDPLEATETKKLVMTPSIARDPNRLSAQLLNDTNEDRVPTPQSADSLKRPREDVDDGSNKRLGLDKGNGKPREPEQLSITRSVSSDSRLSVSSSGHAKLRKDREDDRDKEEKKEKKKGGMLSKLFGGGKNKENSGRDKEKDKDRKRGPGGDGSPTESSRTSEDSSRLGHGPGYTGIPPESTPLSAYSTPPRQTGPLASRNSVDPRRPGGVPSSAQQQQQVSPHTLKMQAADQAQQALYSQQHLTRSPGSPENSSVVAPSYALQSASMFLPSSVQTSSQPSQQSQIPAGSPLNHLRGPLAHLSNTPGGRPGSLILTSNALGSEGVMLPDLNVIRIFAGPGLHTEATFKTVLLNQSTTSNDLIRQAMQRFRLPAGESLDDYYLVIKQIEGSKATLKPDEKPLLVFEGLVEAAQLPKVKRSSIGSINSVSSNLSQHPAIRSLGMNDFTDDSTVKLYLNRKGAEGFDDDDDEVDKGEEGEDDTIVLNSDREKEKASERDSADVSASFLRPPPHHNSPNAILTSTGTVTPERFTSPSVRFSLQLVIFPEDLPDGMVFDPQTEAIVPKSTLRDRSQSGSYAVSQTKRRKVFSFPKNTTVAEVIELGLERFGILEGVVDGGDDVDDKVTKRRSHSRVKYGLSVLIDGHESSLVPTSKIIDAYPRPPTYRQTDRRSMENKRRSIDSTLLLAASDDIQPDDPTFILRRVAGYRLSLTGRSRLSGGVPLDEFALRHAQAEKTAHRESAHSDITVNAATPTTTSATNHTMITPSIDVTESKAVTTSPRGQAQTLPGSQTQQGMSRQELIAAQRAASRANQRAILSAQQNAERGVDVVLPDKARLRSTQYEHDTRMRYSYVDPDGEAYDISQIVEEEAQSPRLGPATATRRNDLLEGVLVKNHEKLDNVLNKIRDTKNTLLVPNAQNLAGQPPHSASTINTTSTGRSSPSAYSPSDAEGLSATRAEFELGPVPAGVKRVLSPTNETVRGGSPAPNSANRSITPTGATPGSRTATPTGSLSGISRYDTPVGGQSRGPTPAFAPSPTMTSETIKSPAMNRSMSNGPSPLAQHAQKPSDASTRSDDASSSYRTASPTNPATVRSPSPSGLPAEAPTPLSGNSNAMTPSTAGRAYVIPTTAGGGKRPIIPKDEFGFSRMMALIELHASMNKPVPKEPVDEVEKLLFGPFGNGGGVEELHPSIREIYEPSFKTLKAFDKDLDELMMSFSDRL